MKFVCLFVLFYFGEVICEKETYKAATIKAINKNDELNTYIPLILEAGKSDVDIVVLPAQEKIELADNYEEIIKNISNAAKQAGVYVAVNLFENILCQHKSEIVKNNVVFDRLGKMAAVYKKPLKNLNNCTSVDSEVSFNTDFGVTFGLLTAEDLVLQNPRSLDGLRNFIVLGVPASHLAFFSDPQLTQSWAYIKKANVISSTGIYASGFGVKNENKMAVAELKKNGPDVDSPPYTKPSDLSPPEDLSFYSVKPLDLEAASNGLQETVCYEQFCCLFKLKTKMAVKPSVTFMLAAFDGVREFTQHQSIGVQNCAIFACTSPNKESCVLSVEKPINVVFEHINISGNFSKQTIQYPIVLSPNNNSENFNYETKVTDKKLTKIEIIDSQMISVGIFGRNFENDAEKESLSNFYDYIFNENVLEFIDYVWIRLRILIFVVSIYILEMM